MRNEGGFIAERRPGERGLAHLVEHIVFLSPTTKSPEEFRHFVHVGLPLTYPAPSAGSTSWRETNYYLSTKTTSPADLDTLLGLFREASSDLTFRTDAVDAARAEVVREMADKKPGNAIYAAYIAAVAPGSPNDMIDGQNSDDVPIASVETIRGLYRRLYRPEAMMIVIVGDVDPADAARLVEKHFGDWKSARPVSPKPPAHKIDRDRIRDVSFLARPQGRRTAIVTVAMPTPPPSTREGQARSEIMDMVVTRVIERRLAAAQPGSAPGKTGIFVDNGDQGFRQITLWDNFSGDQWKPAVAGLRKMTCTLATAGFTDEEWTVARQEVIAGLERRSQAMSEVPNVELAKDLSHALAENGDLLLPDELLREAKRILPGIDVRSGSDWWRRQWTGSQVHIRVEAPELAQLADPARAIRETADSAVDRARCRA